MKKLVSRSNIPWKIGPLQDQNFRDISPRRISHLFQLNSPEVNLAKNSLPRMNVASSTSITCRSTRWSFPVSILTSTHRLSQWACRACPQAQKMFLQAQLRRTVAPGRPLSAPLATPLLPPALRRLRPLSLSQINLTYFLQFSI